MDEDWGEVSFDEPDTTDVEEPSTEADETPVAEEAADSTPEEATETVTPETFTINYLGNLEEYDRDAFTALAQKGRNYDHVKGEWDTAKGKVSEYEDFFRALDPDKSIEDIMDETRARIISQRDNLDIELAKQKVKLERERKAFEASKQAAQSEQAAAQAEEDRKNREFQRFAREYKDVDAKTIPKEVWDGFNAGGSLSDLYRGWENTQLKNQIKDLQSKLEAAEQNAKNQARAVGSMQTAGSAEEQDKLFEGWIDP